jgi:DNA-binding NarL/FixJ family response regulator
MAMAMISILLVEHPPAVRRTLRARLSLEPDIAVVGEADGTPSAVGLAQELRPDVVLLDAEMPDLDVGEAVRALRERSPSSAAVILSLHPSSVARALGAGAAPVVGKHEGIAVLLAAIRSAADGRHDR